VTILAKPSDRKGLGAGFVVRSSRLLATNHRVIAGTPVAVAVQRRPDGTEGISRGIQGFVACDPQADLALLLLAEDWPSEPLRLASASPAIGAAVFAAGSKEGILGVVSPGIVTAVGTAAEINVPNLAARLGVLRTDVPIFAGMSGGPMCDQVGQVVGVTTFCRADAASRGMPPDDGLRFAITAAELSRLIERRGDRVRPLSELPGIRR
jgi:serine protease Do